MLNVGLFINTGGISSGLYGDSISINNILNSHPDIKCTLYTFKKNKNVHCDYTVIDDTFDINQLDEIVIYNTSTVMFGGNEVVTQTQLYRLLSKYNKPIYYILIDTKYPVTDYWESIKSKKWAQKYTEGDFKLKFKPHIISMFTDKDFIMSKQKVDIDKFFICSLGCMPFYSNRISTSPLFGKSVDLIYGGFARNTERKNNLVKFLFNHQDLRVEVYGVPEEYLLSNKNIDGIIPIFTPKVAWDDVYSKNSTAYSTIIVAEQGYTDLFIPRFAESLLAEDCIVFVQDSYNPSHSILGDDFFYVSDGEELSRKTLLLKNDLTLREKYLTLQKDVINRYSSIDVGQEFYSIFTSN